MRYLYGILEEGGYDEIKLGTLYIGGCTLDTHYTNMSRINVYLGRIIHDILFK
jgi:hypothetical protein